MFGSPQGGTVAILAQGADWAVAVTQAFFVRGSIPAARRSCLAGGNLAALLTLAGPEPALYSLRYTALLRTPGVEPGSQAWEACMMPLHYVRYVTNAMFATSRIFAIICPHVLLWAALARPLADRYNASV